MKYAYFGCLVIGQLICLSLHGQFYFSAGNRPEPELLWEFGGSAGAVNCLTDIGGRKGAGKKFIKDINWNQTQFCGALFASATWHGLFAVRLQATMGRVTGSDAVLKNTAGIAKNRWLRNLHFRTTFIELAAITGFYPLAAANKNKETGVLSPYIIAGIGFFNYNPQAMLNNVWVNLRPLYTEGQGFKEYPTHHTYKPISWCMPAGAGIRYDASGLINLRFEMLYRFTGTDYLDDVSSSYIDPSLFSRYLSPVQAMLAEKLSDRSAELSNGVSNNNNAIRGNPKDKDAFFSFNLTMSIAPGRTVRK